MATRTKRPDVVAFYRLAAALHELAEDAYPLLSPAGRGRLGPDKFIDAGDARVQRALSAAARADEQ